METIYRNMLISYNSYIEAISPLSHTPTGLVRTTFHRAQLWRLSPLDRT